jgi:hypothetical protein
MFFNMGETIRRGRRRCEIGVSIKSDGFNRATFPPITGTLPKT